MNEEAIKLKNLFERSIADGIKSKEYRSHYFEKKFININFLKTKKLKRFQVQLRRREDEMKVNQVKN